MKKRCRRKKKREREALCIFEGIMLALARGRKGEEKSGRERKRRRFREKIRESEREGK